MDKDFLISSGTEKIQNTWMDAKYGDFAFTPRNGKAVEINALWYNALKIMQEFAATCESKEEANIYKEMAEEEQKIYSDMVELSPKEISDMLEGVKKKIVMYYAK